MYTERREVRLYSSLPHADVDFCYELFYFKPGRDVSKEGERGSEACAKNDNLIFLTQLRFSTCIPSAGLIIR